jgi:hypothetical protein
MESYTKHMVDRLSCGYAGFKIIELLFYCLDFLIKLFCDSILVETIFPDKLIQIEIMLAKLS